MVLDGYGLFWAKYLGASNALILLQVCFGSVLILRALSGVVIGNHRFPLPPVLCIFYSDSNYLQILHRCIHNSPLSLLDVFTLMSWVTNALHSSAAAAPFTQFRSQKSKSWPAPRYIVQTTLSSGQQPVVGETAFQRENSKLDLLHWFYLKVWETRPLWSHKGP